ncbi:wall-associated protein [Listeria weihenstephanensis FSL R9-0317]|uniref:hypothetical protein n=1 Tax=Listeria weihenstephanensis TaxID=1006155 RepID=UPI0003E88832|nr:hypothetical protein [Listeria weihenstephanensis]EUJ36830.1 wall-associated protein [Listeria weihenstephanensis FSL R9-0317]
MDVGDTTRWNSNGKGIWPTKEEVSNGRYKLHIDGSGGDIQKDSSLVYKNAYNATKKYDYSTRIAHFVRVIAVYPQGESQPSDIVMNLFSFPKINVGVISQENEDNRNGYLSFSWDDVESAVGYKVWIFDGKYYVPFDVGTATLWDTDEKGIWPTKEELERNINKLHTDYNGGELSSEPSRLYKLNSIDFSSNDFYHTKVTAYDKYGATIAYFQVPPINLGENINADVGAIDNIQGSNNRLETENFSISYEGNNSYNVEDKVNKENIEIQFTNDEQTEGTWTESDGTTLAIEKDSEGSIFFSWRNGFGLAI